ncbi:MAG: hypothetical protein M0R06_17665 [Sphaerochaeta sp.]|jgi:hypothetical protein|nr:hypothetical protein [Sphaerochaeta sp.]
MEKNSAWGGREAVTVTWEDAHEAPKGWMSPEEAAAAKTVACVSVGMLVADDGKGPVVIAQDLCGDGDLNGVTAIPRGCVLSVRRLAPC